MKRQPRHVTKSPVGRRLRKTLDLIAETPPQSSFSEAGQFVCSVCDFPVQPCKGDFRAKCFRMLREGTELQNMFLNERDHKRRCLECGKLLSPRLLARNASAELCATCTKRLIRSRTGSKSQRSLP